MIFGQNYNYNKVYSNDINQWHKLSLGVFGYQYVEKPEFKNERLNARRLRGEKELRTRGRRRFFKQELVLLG